MKFHSAAISTFLLFSSVTVGCAFIPASLLNSNNYHHAVASSTNHRPTGGLLFGKRDHSTKTFMSTVVEVDAEVVDNKEKYEFTVRYQFFVIGLGMTSFQC